MFVYHMTPNEIGQTKSADLARPLTAVLVAGVANLYSVPFHVINNYIIVISKATYT